MPRLSDDGMEVGWLNLFLPTPVTHDPRALKLLGQLDDVGPFLELDETASNSTRLRGLHDLNVVEEIDEAAFGKNEPHLNPFLIDLGESHHYFFGFLRLLPLWAGIIYLFFRRFVGTNPCSMAFSKRFCLLAFAGVVDFAFTPPGVLTETRPLPTFLMVTGISPLYLSPLSAIY